MNAVDASLGFLFDTPSQQTQPWEGDDIRWRYDLSIPQQGDGITVNQYQYVNGCVPTGELLCSASTSENAMYDTQRSMPTTMPTVVSSASSISIKLEERRCSNPTVIVDDVLFPELSSELLCENLDPVSEAQLDASVDILPLACDLSLLAMGSITSQEATYSSSSSSCSALELPSFDELWRRLPSTSGDEGQYRRKWHSDGAVNTSQIQTSDDCSRQAVRRVKSEIPASADYPHPTMRRAKSEPKPGTHRLSMPTLNSSNFLGADLVDGSPARRARSLSPSPRTIERGESPSRSKSPTRRRSQHICQYCKKGLDTKYKLERHIRTHTGERPFGCEQCRARFNQKSSLKTHSHIHAREFIQNSSSTEALLTTKINGYTLDQLVKKVP